MKTYTIAEEIKQELAEKFAATQHLGYCFETQGDYFAVDTDGDGVLDTVYHAEENRPWNPWHDNAVAIPAEDCFNHNGNDFSWGEYEDPEVDEEQAIDWALENILSSVEVDEAEA